MIVVRSRSIAYASNLVRLPETILLGGTIRENILYERLDATEEGMIEAAKAADAHEFIMDFPKQKPNEMNVRECGHACRLKGSFHLSAG